MKRAQGVDLRDALRFRVILQVCADHAQRPEWRLHDRLDGHARHGRAGIGRTGQGMPRDVQHRQPRGDGIAEAPDLCALVALQCDAVDQGECLSERSGQFLPLVLTRLAGQMAEARRDLLQAQHVERPHGARFGQHARQVDPAIRAAAPLDVPCQDDGAHACPPVSYNAALVPNSPRLARVSSRTSCFALVAGFGISRVGQALARITQETRDARGGAAGDCVAR